MMPLAEILVVTDGGPWADHNMPCAVCRERAAVLDLNSGRMEPCWFCQDLGWVLLRKRSWFRSFAAARVVVSADPPETP